MSLRSFLAKKLTKDPDFVEAQKQLKIQRILEQRSKNSNERELERFMEEARQKRIKMNLERFRNKQKEEMRSNIFKGKNIFKGHKSVLHQDKDKKMLTFKIPKEKNIFINAR